MDLEDLSEISDDWAIRKIFLDSSVTLLTRYSQSSVHKSEKSWRRRENHSLVHNICTIPCKKEVRNTGCLHSRNIIEIEL